MKSTIEINLSGNEDEPIKNIAKIEVNIDDSISLTEELANKLSSKIAELFVEFYGDNPIIEKNMMVTKILNWNVPVIKD